MAIRDDDPRQGITDYLRKHPTDLLIMATEGRTGMARLINSSVAETVTQNTRSHTLMLPKNGRGLVDPSTGKTRLSRVVCALDPDRDPRPALAYLRQWLPAFGAAEIEVLMLQTCAAEQAVELLLPQTARLSWRSEARPGEPVASIVGPWARGRGCVAAGPTRSCANCTCRCCRYPHSDPTTAALLRAARHKKRAPKRPFLEITKAQLTLGSSSPLS
jgi:hypothetical protein